MKRREVRAAEKEIQERFYASIEYLIHSGQIRGLKTFCRIYGLNAPQYINIKNGAGAYRFIDTDALTYLVRDFGISATWLLTGEGEMLSLNYSEVAESREA